MRLTMGKYPVLLSLYLQTLESRELMLEKPISSVTAFDFDNGI